MTMTFCIQTRVCTGLLTAVASSVFLACGGGSSSPTAPSGGGGATGSVGATVTINAQGQVTPSQVTISVGQSVMFVNNDSRAHEMASDPHPVHTDCPPVNAMGNIGAGQSRTTNAFTTARACGFHDHNDPGNAALQGRIVIQ